MLVFPLASFPTTCILNVPVLKDYSRASDIIVKVRVCGEKSSTPSIGSGYPL